MIRTEAIEWTGAPSDWNSYVAASGAASPYHSAEWQEILSRSFGHRSRIVVARADGKVCGVLPLVEMRSAMFGHFLVSLPFVDYGGIVAESPRVETALAEAAIAVAIDCGARHIELRQSHAMRGVENDQWRLREHKRALVVRVGADIGKYWMSLSSRLRGKIRKAEKAGAIFSASGMRDLDEFYNVYSLNMRNLGTPVYSRSFFDNIMLNSDQARVLVVRKNGTPLAAALALIQDNSVSLPWICSDYEQSQWYGNEYLYWKTIEWAASLGADAIDFGRSSVDSGPYRFKKQWNPEEHQLYWYYWLAPGSNLPELNPDNRKYALAIRLWKKLPLAVANGIGPWIVRNIP